jgi:hypothetical protein
MKVALDLPDDAVTVVASPPKLFTRHNCQEQLGMTEGEFAAALARARASGVAVLTIGKLLAVEPEPFLRLAREQRARERKPANDGVAGPSIVTASPSPPASPLTEANLDQMHRLAPARPTKGR